MNLCTVAQQNFSNKIVFCPKLYFLFLWLFLSDRFAFSQHAISSSRSSGSRGLWTTSSTTDGIWRYVLWLHCLFCNQPECVCQSDQNVVFIDSFVSAGGPIYPPNQYGGGRGNYDNFRGQGGYLGKPRNIRWDNCTCDLYFAMSCLYLLLLESFEPPLFFGSFLYLFLSFFSPPCSVNHLRMSRGDPRNIIEYRDLDAPDDMDFF